MELAADIDVLREMIPPKEEMKLIGPIFDVETYISTGQNTIANLRNLAYLKPSDSVLDIGCGLGRVAIHLTQFLAPSSSYLGLDVGERQISWCADNISNRHPAFKFVRLDAFNAMYNPNGAQKASAMTLPVSDASFDVCFLTSVFTHMFPDDVKAYLSEIRRCLKPNGVLYSTFFLMNGDTKKDVAAGRGQFKFQQTGKGYYTANPQMPEAAIAYEEDDVFGMLDANGLRVDKVVYGNWSGKSRAVSGQDAVVSLKSSD